MFVADSWLAAVSSRQTNLSSALFERFYFWGGEFGAGALPARRSVLPVWFRRGRCRSPIRRCGPKVYRAVMPWRPLQLSTSAGSRSVRAHIFSARDRMNGTPSPISGRAESRIRSTPIKSVTWSRFSAGRRAIHHTWSRAHSRAKVLDHCADGNARVAAAEMGRDFNTRQTSRAPRVVSNQLYAENE